MYLWCWVLLFSVAAVVNKMAEFKATEDEQAELDKVSDPEDKLSLELEYRLKRLGESKRRETISRFSKAFEAPSTFSNATSSKVEKEDEAKAKSNITVETSNRNIKTFSGYKKLGNGEVNFRRWLRAAKRVQADDELTDSQKKRIITRSLTGKADDAIEFVRGGSVSTILDVLTSIYGTVEDPEDLKVEFYQRYQEEKEVTSDYLTELFLDVTEIITLGGFKSEDITTELVKQFCRGTHDEDMLVKLRLEELGEHFGRTLQFSQLFTDVRKEEARRTQRRLRHKTKKFRSQAQVATDEGKETSYLELLQKVDARLARLEETQKTLVKDDSGTGFDSGVAQINSRLARLEEQAKLQGQQRSTIDSGVGQINSRMARLEEQERAGKPRADIFCYRCGQDFHFATDCKNPPNKALVKEKAEARRLRRTKQEN